LRDKTTATTTVLFTWKINLTGNKKYNSFDAGALQEEEEAAIVTKGSFDEYKKEDIRGGNKKAYVTAQALRRFARQTTATTVFT
jgi:hypothetical protein